MDEQIFLQYLKEKMQLKTIRHTALTHKPVKTVALCGGAGSFLLGAAIAQHADVFVSADFKYHEFFDAEDQIVIADIGHYESEQFTIELIAELIRKKIPTFALRSIDRIHPHNKTIEARSAKRRGGVL